MSTKQIACQWCGVLNDEVAAECVACGGPLEAEVAPYPPPKLYTVEPALAPATPMAAVEKRPGEIDELAQGAEKLMQGAAGAYSLFWQTLGEALGIAVSCLVLGFFGGAIGGGGWALLACAAVGLAVGLTTKPFWLAALSAPLGALLGAVIGLAFWLVGMRVPAVALLPGAVLALLAALLGGKRGGVFQGWQRLRPFLGLIGGFAFGLGGVLLGRLLQLLVQYLLSHAFILAV